MMRTVVEASLVVYLFGMMVDEAGVVVGVGGWADALGWEQGCLLLILVMVVDVLLMGVDLGGIWEGS